MNHIIEALGQGWTPGAYGVWSGILLFIGWWLNERRKDRKLSLEERQANREGFSGQVKLLMAECNTLREWGANLGKQLQVLRDEYDEHRQLCFAETDQLRAHVRRLEEENAGVKRELATQGIELAHLKAQTGGIP